jgi:hypothetical protein
MHSGTIFHGLVIHGGRITPLGFASQNVVRQPDEIGLLQNSINLLEASLK